MNNHADNISIFFSVVIPLHNKENQVYRTINSVLSQTYKNFEIIVVDDGSTDNSIDIVNKINDPRIQIIKQSNKGVSAARNKGIKHAKYNHIAFIDADDCWNESFLKSIKNLIVKYPDAGAYATGYKIVNQLNKEIIPRSIIKFGEKRIGKLNDYFKFAIEFPIVTASSVVIPKKIFNELGGFLENINRGEDLEMWCRVALNYQIAFDSHINAIYFTNYSDQATKKDTVIEKSLVYIAEDILEKNRGKGNSTKYFERYMNRRIIHKARLYADYGNTTIAIDVLKRNKIYLTNWKRYVKTILTILIAKVKRK